LLEEHLLLVERAPFRDVGVRRARAGDGCVQELVREAHVQQQRWPVDEEEPLSDAHASRGDAEDPMAVEEVEVAEELIKGLEYKRRRAHVVLENRRRRQSAQG
jgi:hypothetical protein